MGLLRILRLRKQFAAVSAMTSKEVESIQQRNIRAILDYATARSPFYRELYSGLMAEELLEGGFTSIPATDKLKIMDNFDRVVTTPQLKRNALEHYIATTSVGKRYMGKFQVVHTSGSSGHIGISVYDPLAWDTLKAMVLARCTDFGLGLRRKRFAFIGLTDGHYAGVTLASDVSRLFVAYTQVSVNEPVSRMVERLNKFRPDDLRGYPSGLYILAVEQLAGRLNIHPTNIISSAEPLDEDTRHLIKEAFGVIPYNFYAASESIGIAQDCSLHKGLHVFNDLYVLEIVDEKGEPVEPGKEGQIMLTNLYNKCQPLIRYRMLDRAAYSEEECECGLPFPLLKSIGGRQEEVIWVENGNGGYEVIHPIVFIGFFVPGLRRLQVHQIERNHLLLLVVAEGKPDEVSAAVLRRMREILAGKNLQDVVQFEVKMVDSIPPDRRTGKTKTVISEIGPPRRF